MTSGPTPFCRCKLFSRKACPGNTSQHITLWQTTSHHTTSYHITAQHSTSQHITSHHTCRFQTPDIPRSGRVGAHGGAAGRGWAERDADRTVRPGDKRPWYPPRHRIHFTYTSHQKHEQAKSYKPMEEQNPWLTTGSQPIHPRFITETRSALRSRKPSIRPTPFLSL